jgi:hypothetical protein
MLIRRDIIDEETALYDVVSVFVSKCAIDTSKLLLLLLLGLT